MHNFHSRLAATLLLAWLVAATASAQSQSYPNRSIRLIAASTPGGTTDFIARLIGQKLSAALGQPVVVDNRGGAGGNVAADLAAKASPDGYTLIVVASSHATNLGLYSKLSYDPVKDFAPVSLLIENSFFLAVHPSVPVNSFAEFVAWAKGRKEAFNYSSAGAGQGNHLGMELLKARAGFNAVHVPYSGMAPATQSLVGGQVDAALLTPVSALPFAQSGKMKIIAATGTKRSTQLPAIPTIAETYPGFEVAGWQALLAPQGTPKEVIDVLHREVAKALKQPDVIAALNGIGLDPVGSTPQAFAAFLRDEIAKWGQVIKQSGAKAD